MENTKSTNEKSKSKKQYTPWHTLLAEVMVYIIDPDDFLVHPFVKLGTLPLESDLIIIRKRGSEKLKKTYLDLEFMIPYLGKYTVLEYKSPLDRLTFDDFDRIRAYMMLIKDKYKISYDKDIHAISLVSSFQYGYREHIEKNGYEFRKIDTGVYGHIDDNHHFYWFNLEKIGEKYPENFINLFSSNFKKYREKDEWTKIQNINLFNYIYKLIYEKEASMNNIEIRQCPEFTESAELMKQRFLESLDPEERLAGLKPKERLAGLKPKERLAGLKPKERLAGLKPKEILAELKPKAILAELKRKEILSKLNPEDMEEFAEILNKFKDKK